MTEDRITHVTEMRDLRFVKQDAALQFARIPHHTPVADDYILPYVGVMAYLAVAANDCRSLNHYAVLEHRPLADEHLLAHVSLTLTPVFQARPQVCPYVIL